ncbi:MAG: hypothetical protein ACI4PE_00475 [Bacilli bacterium]
MGYVKSGIVTRIEILNENKDSTSFIRKNFNLDLYTQKGNIYFLKEKILQQNLKSFREEFLLFSEGRSDSLDSCEAYCLEIDVNKMLQNKIYLIKDNKSFCFDNYVNMKFETDEFVFSDKKVLLRIFLIPIFWDIDKVETVCLNNTILLVNNLTRKAMKNILKDASWVTII